MVILPAKTFAQADGSPLEEIIVTAQKREQSLRDVPISIFVATREQLERDQIYSVLDLSRAAPGLEVSPTAGAEANGGGRIRGIGTNLFNESATASVAVVVDQQPTGNVAMPDILDMAQVEVLRGPQGTLFGASASAGVISITSVAPDPTGFSAEVGADYQWDKYTQRVIRAAANVPITDTSALRVAARSTFLSGAKTNRLYGEEDENDLTSLRVRFRTEPSEDLLIDLFAEYHNSTGSDQFFNLGVAPKYPVFAGPNMIPPAAQLAAMTACGDAGPFEVTTHARVYCSEKRTWLERSWMSLGAIVDWNMGDHTLTSVTSYRKKDHDDQYRNYSRQWNQLIAQLYYEGYTGEQVAQELRIASDPDATVSYVAGAYISDYTTTKFPTGGKIGDLDDPAGFVLCNFSKTFCIGPPPPIGPIWPQFTFADVETSTQAVFADGEIDLNETTTLFGGLRYTNHDLEFATGINGPFTNFGDKNDSEVSGRLGARWGVGADGTMYASVSRGFKPSYVDVPANPLAETTVLDPELNTSLEVGGKFGLAGGRLSLDANLFRMNVENYQAQEQILVQAELVVTPVNVPEVISQGVEVSLYGSITDNLSFSAGYIYNSAKYPDGFLSDDPTPVDLGGEQVAQSPERKLTISGEWFTPVGGAMEAFVNLNAIHNSDIRAAQRAQEEFTYPAHARWGGSVGLRSADGRWSARLFGRNLGDEPYILNAYATTFIGQENGGVRLWTFPGVSFRQVGFAFDVSF